MAKKKATGKGESKVVTKCDTLDAMSPDHDELITSVAQSSSEGISIKSMIRLVRGQQVMAHGVYAALKEEDENLRLDAIDLAKEYFTKE